jgi:SAM-dependent methyltransferase
MQPGFLAPYESALATSSGVGLLSHDGRRLRLDVPRYLGTADAVDDTVLQRCRGPVLDIGCGPGRLVHALTRRGFNALGIDIAQGAVDLTRRGGGRAIVRDVYGLVPAMGTWRTGLLIDGNIGIYGNADRLLARAAELLSRNGHLIVEATGAPGQDEVLGVRFCVDDRPSGGSFDWAVLDTPALIRRGVGAGLYVIDSWSAGGRSFVEFAKPLDSSRSIRTT